MKSNATDWKEHRIGIHKIRQYRNPVKPHPMVTLSMMAPYTIILFVFIIIPIIAAIVISFTSFNMIQTPKYIGAQNYMYMLLSDDIFLLALKNTIIFALITGPVGYILSFFIAWMLNEFGGKLRAFLTLVFYMPTLAGNVYFIWTYLFSGDSYGLVNSFALRLGIIKEPIMWLTDTRYNFWVCIALLLWSSLGVGFLSIVAAMKSLNKELSEAGAIDGIRNRFQELFHIVLPQMLPALTFAAVMTISTSFTVGYQIMQLTGFPSTDYSVHTIVLHIMDYGMMRYEMGYASALAVVLFLLLIIVWRYISLLLRKISSD